MVLQVLYDNIKDKSKILVNKRVGGVALSDSNVTVNTKEGDSYTGDILVGADGIHSIVRKEMWRLADAMKPGYIPSSEMTGQFYLTCVSDSFLMILFSDANRL